MALVGRPLSFCNLPRRRIIPEPEHEGSTRIPLMKGYFSGSIFRKSLSTVLTRLQPCSSSRCLNVFILPLCLSTAYSRPVLFPRAAKHKVLLPGAAPASMMWVPTWAFLISSRFLSNFESNGIACSMTYAGRQLALSWSTSIPFWTQLWLCSGVPGGNTNSSLTILSMKNIPFFWGVSRAGTCTSSLSGSLSDSLSSSSSSLPSSFCLLRSSRAWPHLYLAHFFLRLSCFSFFFANCASLLSLFSMVFLYCSKCDTCPFSRNSQFSFSNCLMASSTETFKVFTRTYRGRTLIRCCVESSSSFVSTLFCFRIFRSATFSCVLYFATSPHRPRCGRPLPNARS
mmetsp:Transcript_78036/g.131081  ORF Transcript_78036/g.131081 Transcript_78036/m.131081 type:complete len:341 (-) Transcript_78036:440-1462(-)